jgi:hypothetical protein
MAQANFKPGHKRSVSDVTDKQSEKMLVASSRTRTHSEKLDVQDEPKSPRRKNSDVVDSIGDKVEGAETTATEFDDAVGRCQRPTTLDMKQMVHLEKNQKKEAWKSNISSSKEETDATPCTPPEITYSVDSDSR